MEIENGVLLRITDEDIVNGTFETPDNVISIGRVAFAGCSSLKEIIIPDSVTYIGRYAFDDCVILTNIRIPENIRNINDLGFDTCDNLETIIWGNKTYKKAKPQCIVGFEEE